MNPRGPLLLSELTIAKLHTLIRRGFATVQEFADPIPLVQFRRFDHAAGRFLAFGPEVQLITIDFGLRESKTTEGVPLAETSSDGDMSLWAEDFTPEVGDRFSYLGRLIEVTATFPEEFGVITCEVSLVQ